MLFIQGILEKQHKRNKNWQMSQYIIPYQQMSVLANVPFILANVTKPGKAKNWQMSGIANDELANVQIS